MKLVRFFARLIFGFVFISSGWFKIMDPVGTGLQVTEYLNAAHLDFLSFASIPAGMALVSHSLSIATIPLIMMIFGIG
jgi:uncharacterized membrane protein YphA (DoxX/SURF4 family)